MAVSRIGSGAGGTSTGAAVTFNGPNITTSDVQTIAIVAVVLSVSSNSTATTCGVTYGGVAMTQLNLTLVGSSTNRAAVGYYYLFNPGTGIKSVVVTPGGASTKAQVRCQAVAFSGVGSIGTAQTATTTTHAVTSVVNGYSLRVLSNGGALTSPNQTQEYLGGASPLGVGDYMCMQSAVGTGSSISFTCSGTAATPQSVGVSIDPPLPKVETLTDDCAADTGKHTLGTGATYTGGRLRLESRADYGASAISVAQYSAADTTFTWEFAGTPSNAGSYIDMGLSLLEDFTDRLVFQYNNGVLSMMETVAGTENPTTVAYNATNHRWLQIEITGATVNWNTSATGLAGSWTTQRTKSWAVTSLATARTFYQIGGVDDATSAALIDNLNLPPVSGTNTSDFFSVM